MHDDPLLFHLPAGWREAFAGARIERVATGESGADLFRIAPAPPRRGRPRYLKIARGDGAALLRQEIVRTRWLARRGVRVPAILRVADHGGRVAVLTRALPGRPADQAPLPPLRLARALGRALKRLHAIPAAACPFDERFAVRLARAREAVAAGDIDAGRFARRNRATSPAALLARLAGAPPREDNVVVHGDATLANIIVAADGGIGFLDCGHAGRGDRALDLALLAADIRAHYGAAAAAGFLHAYGRPRLSPRKARYILDLYEFF